MTSIEGSAFACCSSLKEITIPDTVTSMGTSVFSGCTSLEKVHIPNIRVNLPDSTFYNCTSLTEVNLPDTLETIGTSAFQNCTSLTEINLPAKVNTINSSAFSGCTGLSKVTIPESMRTINSNAFSHCEALTDLTIAEGTTKIYSNAFEYCKSLERVTLPDTLQELGTYAFRYCDKLASVKIGAGLKVLPSYCFYEDPALEKITLPYQMTTVNSYAFGNCTKFTDVTLNRRISSVALNAFSYPDRLTIHGVSGTYAHTFANENNIFFMPLTEPATAIHLNKTECQVGRGYTIQLTAGLTPEDASDELTWTSTDEDVLTVDANGLVKGIKTGNASVIVMAGDVIETCDVTVYEKVSSVYVSPSSKEMTTGETLQLTATVYPSNATNKNITWKSDNESVAAVSEDGLVTAKAYGTAKITVTSEDAGKTATATITVKPIAVTGISLDSKTVTIGVHTTCQLTPVITPANATDKTVTWTSSKPAVATVENGLITGVSEGTAIIIVKTKDGAKTASCTVTVKDLSVAGITLDRENAEISVGDTLQLNEAIAPADATNRAVTWASDKEAVATVVNGKVTGKKAGTATITVTTADGGYTASCIVTVIGRSVTGVELSEVSAEMFVGDVLCLHAEILPAEADEKGVTWSVSEETDADGMPAPAGTILTIDAQTGLITALSAGSASVTVTTDDGGYEASCVITVTENADTEFVAVEEVEITNSETELEAGKPLQLDVQFTPAEVSESEIFYFSSDEEVATVSEDGVVTGLKAGIVTITAVSKNGGKTISIDLEIRSVAVSGITLESNQYTLTESDLLQMQPKLSPENATNQNVTYTTNRNGIVSVSSGGLVTALKAGGVRVTVKTEDGGFIAFCDITVEHKTGTAWLSDDSRHWHVCSLCGEVLDIAAHDFVKKNTTTYVCSVCGAEKTVEPETPDEPSTPGEPEKPSEPETPSEPGTPSEPEKPSEPGTPDEPEKPSEPSTPSEPEHPSEPKTPAVGDVLQDKASNAVYKVVKAGKSGKALQYVKPITKTAKVTIKNTVKINGVSYKVTAIAGNAFKNNKKITSVTVGKYVTVIGDGAFYGCSKLTTATLGASVAAIGKNAFYNCKKLKTITVKSAKLKTVGKNALKGIYKKAVIKVPKSKFTAYKKLFSAKTGFKKTMKIKK